MAPLKAFACSGRLPPSWRNVKGRSLEIKITLYSRLITKKVTSSKQNT
jgi:hypothetical protein